MFYTLLKKQWPNQTIDLKRSSQSRDGNLHSRSLAWSLPYAYTSTSPWRCSYTVENVTNLPRIGIDCSPFTGRIAIRSIAPWNYCANQSAICYLIHNAPFKFTIATIMYLLELLLHAISITMILASLYFIDIRGDKS